MAIVPPDPGHALALAKSCEYDAAHRCFRRSRVAAVEHRYLRVEGERWDATVLPERTFTAETFALLQDGEPHDGHLFRSPAGRDGLLYMLIDTGFEARAEPVS